MRWPLASLFLIIGSFIFLVMFAVSSLLLTEVGDALEPYSSDLDATFAEELSFLPTAFAIVAAIFFVTGILLIFILDSLSDEPEMYWRR